MITRKDLDHAAGHGHWRVTPPAPNPRNNFMAQLNIFKKIPSVNFLKALGRNGNSNSGAREMAETPREPPRPPALTCWQAVALR
jgi:hypothetical protein